MADQRRERSAPWTPAPVMQRREQARADNVSWWEALAPYLHHTTDCLLQPCTCGLDALASGLGMPSADADADMVRLAIEEMLWERETLPAEWTAAQLLARLPVAGARLEMARNRDWMHDAGYSTDLIQYVADSLRERAVRAGADPENPGRDAIEQILKRVDAVRGKR
jgi:hypothetical protein